MSIIGILLTNTGTPDAPTPSAVRRYLREFLSDRRIVKIPRLIWLPILYGIILTTRPAKSAALYKKIWTPQGSPMRHFMQQIRVMLEEHLNKAGDDIFLVELGMNYGNPSINTGLDKLKKSGAEKIIILPLFPQYSDTTTSSTYDRVNAAIRKWTQQPTIDRIQYYAERPAYIEALANSIRKMWSEKGKPEHLLISFHGIPIRFVEAGDPYQSQCEQTATLLANELKLSPKDWTLCYQSQFGYDKWLKPSTQMLFTELPKQGLKKVDIICPGFPVDCLETLEEIAIAGKKSFIEAGGEALRYIPALNDSEEQVEMLAEIVLENCK